MQCCAAWSRCWAVAQRLGAWFSRGALVRECGRLLFVAAVALARLGSVEQAQKLLEQARASRVPRYQQQLQELIVELHGLSARLAFEQGELDTAQAHLDRALELNPDHPQLNALAAELAGRLGRPEAVTREHLARATRWTPLQSPQ